MLADCVCMCVCVYGYGHACMCVFVYRTLSTGLGTDRPPAL